MNDVEVHARHEAAATLLSVSRGSELDRPLDLDGPTDWPFRPFPEAWLERPIFDIVAEAAAAHPDKTAIFDGASYLTYREIHQQAVSLGQRIAAAVAPGTPVGIGLNNGTSYPVAILGVLAAGCTYVPLDLNLPEGRNAHIIKHSGMTAAVVDGTTRAAMEATSPGLLLVDLEGAPGDPKAELRKLPPDAPGIIVYTSGSTGQPKGVYHSQRGLLHHIMQRVNSVRFSAEDRTLMIFTPAWGAPQQDIFSTLMNGATLFIVDLRKAGLQEAARVMRTARITIFHALPSLFRRLVGLAADPKTFESVRFVNLTSDWVFPADIELFKKYFPQTCHLASCIACSEAWVYMHWYIRRDDEIKGPLVPVGYTLPDFEVALLDSDGEPVPRGDLGEITITSRFTALGYWKEPEMSREAFVASAADPAAHTYRTGDLGRMRVDGCVEMIGRKDRQVKVRGNRVEPAEVEAMIRNHPAVSDAAVIDRRDGENVDLVAYVVAGRGPLTSNELSEWLLTRLSDAMRPREINFVDEMPVLANFKPDIQALKQLDRQRAQGQPGGAAAAVSAAAATQPAAPRDPAVENAVRRSWQRLLDAASYEADTPWQNAGGDSLKGLELIFLLEKALGRPVRMEVLGPSTPPSELIARLQGGPAAPGPQSAARPRVYFIPGGMGTLLDTVRLVEAVAEQIEMVILDYPMIDMATIAPVDFDAMVAHFVAQIRASCGDGQPIRILGYSIGGHLTFEAARRLAASGANVALVGIIDTSPTQARADAKKPYYTQYLVYESFLRRILRVARAGRLLNVRWQRVLEIFIDRQLQRQRYATVTWIWRFCSALGMPRNARAIEKFTNLFLRGNSLSQYRAMPQTHHFAGRMCVFKADDPEWEAEAVGDDLGWGPFCDAVSVWRITGAHLEVFSPTNVVAMKDALVAALRRVEEPTNAKVDA